MRRRTMLTASDEDLEATWTCAYLHAIRFNRKANAVVCVSCVLCRRVL
jgi:hypothetical protein